MKITQIKITDFHQFKDLTIDLTYPKGHAKEGQPLDKVCFIGQSGTGKTSLLELIPKFLYNYNTLIISKSSMNSILNKIKLNIAYGIENEYENEICFFLDKGTKKFTRAWTLSTNKKNKSTFEINFEYYSQKWTKEIATKLIYFPANLNYDIEVGTENMLLQNLIIDFSKEKVSAIWNLILEKIQQYQEMEIRKRGELSKIVEKSTNNLEAIKIAVKNFEDWQKTEFNPIHDIADNCLDKLLQPFNLRVKREFEFTSKEDIGFIKIEDFSGNEIPHGLWSTGTKQVILSAMPLYLLKPKHTVILFDEPERSLYPDMQRFIVDYYSSLTENCQFFYATHSPIIASSFEPWEIVELKFNREGKIYREQYYEGENHIDNYKWNPKHMRWDDILQRVFDIQEDGGPERKKLLDELARSNVKFKKLQQQEKAESEEAKKLLERIIYLRKELSFWD
jgi:predicted ATPase